MSQRPDRRNGQRAERLLKQLLAAGAIVEIGVGLGALVFPEPLIGLLLNAPVAATGIFVARVFGAAIIALGLTWWVARGEPRGRGASGCDLGFISYNLGAGLVILLQALAATQPVPLLWPVAFLHAGLGLGFAAVLLGRSPVPEAK